MNPFINLTMHLPWYHYVKMALVGVTLLPFRILFTIANVFLMWCFATLILAGLSGLHAQRARKLFFQNADVRVHGCVGVFKACLPAFTLNNVSCGTHVLHAAVI